MMCNFLNFSRNTLLSALLSSLALTAAHAASVDPAQTDIESDATEETTGSWDAAGDSAAEAWDATKEASADTWEATKKSSAEAWDATKEFSSDAWDATKEFSIDTWESAKDWVNGDDAEAPITEPPVEGVPETAPDAAQTYPAEIPSEQTGI
jgi:hypothetical protein